MIHLAARAELGSSIAAQLAQPVTALSINIETGTSILRSPQPDVRALREVLNDLRADCERIASVLHHLRDRPMQVEAARRAIDVNAMVGHVLPSIATAAHVHRIEVKTELAPRLPLIEADSIQVLGVPLNLSMNAIEMLKHAVQESRLLTIATSVNNDAVSVSVRHSAPNIAVGCAPPRVAQKIVESHGGRLWVNTAPEGITCAFAIPIFAER